MKNFDIRKILNSTLFVIILFSLAKLILHLLTWKTYGYFVDELYTIACGEHLSWGYVDIPPMAPFLSRLSGTLFGYSLFSIHIFPAVSGALIVFLAGLFTKELGGKRFAVTLACLAVIINNYWLNVNGWFAYDAFDQLFVLIFLYLLLKLIKSGDERKFIFLGIAAGICLLTKMTVLFFAIALLPALLLTKERQYLSSKWFWIALIIAAAVVSPYIIWQFQHNWPFLEYLNIYSRERTYQANIFEYLFMIVIFVGMAMGIWVRGFFYYFKDTEGRAYKLFALLPICLFLILFVILKAKFYMIMTAFIPILAGGCVRAEKLDTPFWRGFNVSMLLIGLVFVPMSLPLLSAGQLEKYFGFFGRMTGSIKLDNASVSQFPQWIADRFGWEELVKSTAGAYRSLSQEERDECVILSGTYGAAGAVDLLGADYGLPKAVCGNLSYYIWGPGDKPGKVVIAVQMQRVDLLHFYSRIDEAPTVYSPYGIPWRKIPVYICRKPKKTLQEAWKDLKSYH